ncbi:MAG: MATE family efflux transporter [Endomicrobium sp.]|jgi:MATE family multidrug resistance protein|nr:MATE family efflux transporter [Endomicrobium sp.]
MGFLENIRIQCKVSGGYLEFLNIAFPLIISTGIESCQIFIDRIFLAKYSQNSFIASTPAGVAYWALVCFFFGTLTYIDIFIAQYYGRKEYKFIGPILWQGVYLTFISTLIVLVISYFSSNIFLYIGHPIIIIQEEIKYFKTLCYGTFPYIAETVFASFYAGRGKTKVVLLVSCFGVVTNILLDYLLIYGKFCFPTMGIEGAAWAGNISMTLICFIYIILMLSKKNDSIYHTRCIKLNSNFIKTILKYGLPNGGELFFDTIGFGIFIFIIGKLGIEELAASNIVSTINNILSMVITGCGVATSIMVGNYLGKKKISIAKLSVKSAIHISFLYVSIIVIALIFIPKQFITLFSNGEEMSLINHINPIITRLLRLLAIYIIFNTINVIFSSAIKGAGDTLFILRRFILYSIFLIIIPTYVSLVVLKCGIYTAWNIMLFYTIALAISFYFRYKSKKWERIHV